MQAMEKINPPVLGYRIGIVGNRDLSGVDIEQVRDRLGWLLGQLWAGATAIRDAHDSRSNQPLYADDAPRFHLINPLAEGADQLAAEVARDLPYNFRLFCPIPFPVAEYKRRFASDDGRERFNALVADAAFESTIIELDCRADTPRHRQEGYRAAADMLLENSDILLALFDPERAGEIGGSIETARFAVQMQLPVIHLNTRDPDSISLLGKSGHFELNGEPVTDQTIDQLLAETLLPAPAGGMRQDSGQVCDRHRDEAIQDVQAFFNDPLIRRQGVRYLRMKFAHGLYAWVWMVLSVLLRLGEGRVAPVGECRDAGNGLVTDTSARERFAALQQPFREKIEWMDRVAMDYMATYRGSFILNFLLGAVAVVLAVLSFFGGGTLLGYKAVAIWTLAELVCVAAILMTYIANRLGDWQKKAVDFRFLAECLRHVEVLVLLGRNTRLLLPTPRQHARHDPANTWMGWYLNAFLRSRGPFCVLQPDPVVAGPAIVRMDESYVHQVKRHMCIEWLEDQYAYHRRQARRFDRWETGSTLIMMALFALIVFGVSSHLFHQEWPHPAGWHHEVFIALTVTALPALLAAIHGITVQGEFKRIAERSAGTADYLAQQIRRFAVIDPKSHSRYADAVGDHAVEAANVMLEEVTDWQVLYRGHAVELT